MIEFKVSIEAKLLQNALNRLVSQAEHLTPLMHSLGEKVKSNIQKSFDISQDSYGKPWQPLKSREGQPLRDTGKLRNSIGSKVSGHQVSIGTNLIYASTHQWGATITSKNKPYLVFKMRGKYIRKKSVIVPPRPFIPNEPEGLPKPWEASLEEVVIKYFNY